MQTVSSASPEALRRYGRTAHAAGARLESEARALDAALASFLRSCREYRVAAAEGVTLRLFAGSREVGELGAWVEGVAAAYLTADTGAVGAQSPLVLSPLEEVFPGAASGQTGRRGHTSLKTYAGPKATGDVYLALAWASVAVLLGKPGSALLSLASPAVVELLWSSWWQSVVVVAEASGAERVGRAFRSLGEALHEALVALGGWGEQHSADLAQFAFEQVVFWTPGLNGMGAGAAVEDLQWNLLGVLLLGPLTAVETVAHSKPALIALAPALLAVLSTPLVVCGLGIAALSLTGEGTDGLAELLQDPSSLPEVLEHGVWGEGFDSLNPYLRRALGARLDALNLTLAALAEEVAGRADQEPPPPPANTVYGAFAAISYHEGEQVVFEQLNGEGDYRVSITGLDPSKPGAPNNFEAVMVTDAFSPEENRYYQHVRERFFEALRQIPPGSKLHLQGHSMGGGMCLLLREDPEVQRRLREAEITVPSLTIYGAVIPGHASFAPVLPAGSPFADTELRAYVNTNDALALNVGAGYDGFAEVQMIGGPGIEAPSHAHGDYANPENYQGVPPELLVLPYSIDPEQYQRAVPLVSPPSPGPVEDPPYLKFA